jgi:broad specificity phosphatase PhoE
MRIIFIRHAEPDYEHRTLTERGFQEARLLADRIPHWKVDRFYVSPLERAKLTAEPSLRAMGRTAEVVDWMQEFSYPVVDPVTNQKKVPWDFMPQYWTREPLLYDKDNFYRHPLLQTNPDYEAAVRNLRSGLDSVLAEYGYHRKDGYYEAEEEKTRGDDDLTLVFFAHLGANLEAVGYLLGISPVVLQQSIYLAPTSLCILNTEKRQCGSIPNKIPAIAMFRAQVLGDVGHLLKGGQSISESGSFARVFNA